MTAKHVSPAGRPIALDDRTAWDGTLPMIGFLSHVAQDREIYHEGAQAQLFYKVVTGVVRTCQFHVSGRRRIDAFHVAGEIFGLEAGVAHRLSAQAVCDSTLISYRSRDLTRSAASSTLLSRHLFVHVMRCVARAQDHALLVTRGSAVEKVAAFLLEWAGHSPGEPTFTLAMTRVDIADYLGLTLETVSRMLARLKREAVIELLTARHVRLVDPGKLRQLAS